MSASYAIIPEACLIARTIRRWVPQAAPIVFQRLADLCLVRLLIAVEQRFCLHDHAVNAVSALRCPFFDERLLQRMRLAGIAQPLKSYYLLAGRA
jgi:hypothetical protein